jgi:poly-gamma-glutamate synthesis protein (capsule biosynthesis protein)
LPKLAIAGDVMLGRIVNETMAERGFLYPWGDVLPLLREADLFLLNLECALTSSREPWHDGDYKAFYFRAEPTAVQTLLAAGVDFASLANNHAMDFGAEGLLDTCRILDEAGIAHAGAGADIDRARLAARLRAPGVSVAVVAFADHPMAWAAAEGRPGINYLEVSQEPEDFAPIVSALSEARKGADFVIFSIHWGPNMRSRPTPDFRQFARRIIEAGADLFWGHSAHLVQGIEMWKGRPILHDTGDFVDDYAVGPERNDLSALFLLEIGPGRVEKVELVPVSIDNMQVNRARDAERAVFAGRMKDLCQEMGTKLTESGARLVVASP